MTEAAKNPFDFQRPRDRAADLIDRVDELDALAAAAADRVAMRLASPRRYGKTSLLRAHLARMQEAGHHTCFIDFDRVATLPDIADRIVSGMATLPGDPRRRIGRRLDRLGLSLGTTGLTVQLAPRAPREVPSPDQARAAIRELLSALGDLATDGTLVVVAMDEFQDLLTADEHVDGLLRSVIQHQPAVAYVFAGSSPTLMRRLFADRERPFFGQARALDLPPLPDDEAHAYIARYLPETPASAPAAEAIVRFADGHPQRLMLLAHELFTALEQAPDANPDDAARGALARGLADLEDAFQTVWTSLNRTERAVLTIVADGLSPTANAASRRHEIPRSTLQAGLARLEDAEQPLLDRRPSGELRLIDPLLAEWLRRR